MAATLLSAAVTCFVALFLGQAALRLAGAREWSWLAPPVGISIAMLVATPTNHVPGRAVTVAVLLAALGVAAAVWCLRSPAHRPPLLGLVAATPVLLLTLVPLLAVGRTGILGVSMNNDMAAHLQFVEVYMSSAVAAVKALPGDYPLGPHAMAALLAKGLGAPTEQAFTGWMMAMPVLIAWSALAAGRRASWFGQVVLATVVGMPFLVAAYYGEGAFKEVVQAGLVLAVVLLLSGYGPALGRGRWVPFALLLGGIISVYSIAGLPWPFLFLGLWLAGVAVVYLLRNGTSGLIAAGRRQLPAIAVGLGVLVVGLLPQLPRIAEFISVRQGGSGIVAEDIGNLAGPLPGWEALGVWNTGDFRFPASPAFTGGMLTAFVLALVLIGAVWAIRRGRWMVPLAAAGAMLIWAISTQSQSPYVSAKGLVIASPLLLLVAVMPLVERPSLRPRWWPLVPLVGLALLLAVGSSAVRALRISPVGPTDHAAELSTFRSTLYKQPTLFLGNDDFIAWELSGVPVENVLMSAAPRLPLRPEKEWAFGEAIDFDSVDAKTLNEYEWIVGTRDAAGSAPPPQLRLVRVTDSYALWRRVGRVAERSILDEKGMAGAVLDCDSRRGREVVRAGGVAAVRPAPVIVSAPPIGPGDTVSVRLPLVRGTWELQTPYTSPLPIEVKVGNLRTTLPANLDRPGQRWRIGRIGVRRPHPVTVTLQTEKELLTPPVDAAVPGVITATPVAPERIVPISSACGLYVDWYRS